MLRVAAIAALALASAAPAAAPAAGKVRWHRLTTETRRGSFLEVGTAAHIDNPKAIQVRVATAPHGRVGGNTLVRCDGRSQHGHVHGPAPLVRTLQLPVPHTGTCTVVVNVTYAYAGRLTVTVLGR